jgi:nicotinamide-nucleotide amidase
METIFEESVLPDLLATFAAEAPAEQRVLRTFGLHEAEVADTLGPLLERGKEPVVGVTARDGVITITLYGKGADARAAKMREILGEHVFGEGDVTLARVALDALVAGGLTLGTAESITGGGLASTIVDEPGASKAFRGSVVAYAADLKKELLGVPKSVLAKEGTVSKETALRMARGVRKALGVDVGVATTGVAGPDSDERGTTVGSGWIAVVGPGKGKKAEAVRKVETRGARNAIRRRFVSHALDLLRRNL